MAKKKETPSVPTDGVTQTEAQQRDIQQIVVSDDNTMLITADVKQDVQQIVDSLPPEVKQAVVNEDLQKVLEREQLKKMTPEDIAALDAAADTPDGGKIPTEEQKALIGRVLEGGKEFKPLHEKLTVLFDRIRPDVQTLKDDVFQISQGSAGVEVLIPTDKGDVWMDWDVFCMFCFGVGSERVRQLLQVKDKEHGTKVKQSPKISITKDDYQKALDEAYEAGVAAGAFEEEDDESEVPEVLRTLEQTLTQVTTVADKSYEYFHQFKDEPETYGMEISAMLIEHGLDLTTIERIFKFALKDAKKTLCDMTVKSVTE